jgi:hypothetical protein
MEHHAAHQLNVEMTLSQGPLRRLAHHGEGVRQYVVFGLAGIQPGTQYVGLSALVF